MLQYVWIVSVGSVISALFLPAGTEIGLAFTRHPIFSEEEEEKHHLESWITRGGDNQKNFQIHDQ